MDREGGKRVGKEEMEQMGRSKKGKDFTRTGTKTYMKGKAGDRLRKF